MATESTATFDSAAHEELEDGPSIQAHSDPCHEAHLDDHQQTPPILSSLEDAEPSREPQLQCAAIECDSQACPPEGDITPPTIAEDAVSGVQPEELPVVKGDTGATQILHSDPEVGINLTLSKNQQENEDKLKEKEEEMNEEDEQVKDPIGTPVSERGTEPTEQAPSDLVDNNPLDFRLARQQWAELETGACRPPQPQEDSRSCSEKEKPCSGEKAVAEVPATWQSHGDDAGGRELALDEQDSREQGSRPPPLAAVAPQAANRKAEEVLAGDGEEPAGSELTGGESQPETEEGSGTPGCWPPGDNTRSSAPTGPMETEIADNMSDSGVSADFSPGSTLELNSGPDGPPPCETPIEREIRLTMEREESLRKARGISKPTVSEEYVDIPLMKPILAQPLPAALGKGKERQFAGKQMQKEILMDTKREEDLVLMGKVPGEYDRGGNQELHEKKILFEQFQEKCPENPETPLSRKPSSPSSMDAMEVDGAMQSCSNPQEVLGSATIPDPACPAPKGPSLSEGISGNVIILENSIALHPIVDVPALNANYGLPASSSSHACQGSTFPEESVTILDSRSLLTNHNRSEKVQLEDGVPKENPFFKLRSSKASQPVVEQDIREAQEREMELRRQRYSLYGSEVPQEGTAGGEEELLSAPMPAERLSSGKLDVTWPPPQSTAAEGDQAEMNRSPKPPRQKTPLLQRWETGMVNGHQEE
ncbi:uncharacterized protein si:ch211-207j7.2 [Polypterus senegalus]|uniref:uncharacterized protein si:ch211-207j7.2 n=1 Tax=Polypterus senegalus TaxID=55291 RepID=UPI0019652B2D|nr:uncharacterized protein si:ch211-207j7.2 [Polypterus senegalus]XP_039628483.1 uncharacterized protein si:ch211-207j7.2 [Polypterus senegalus]XP_039628484.1 uncharacterized protein si:ch211-207j7.2 [Polypterus senegalus]XP_039628485.1 uncharacterized protein si:ch211-207j7.2 [Polypterus senegalus]